MFKLNNVTIKNHDNVTKSHTLLVGGSWYREVHTMWLLYYMLANKYCCHTQGHSPKCSTSCLTCKGRSSQSTTSSWQLRQRPCTQSCSADWRPDWRVSPERSWSTSKQGSPWPWETSTPACVYLGADCTTRSPFIAGSRVLNFSATTTRNYKYTIGM